MVKKNSFTLIELLVTLSIISLLSSLVLIYYNIQVERAKDYRRVSDLKQIQNKLEVYYQRMGQYPDALIVDETSGGWDVGNVGRGPGDTFIQPLVDEGLFVQVPVEQDSQLSGNWSYRYHRYVPDEEICSGRGFYVLAAYLTSPQENYKIKDEVDPCYEAIENSFWENSHWYTIMSLEALQE